MASKSLADKAREALDPEGSSAGLSIGDLVMQTPAPEEESPPWLEVTQVEYDALDPPDPNILYVVVG